MAKKQDIEELIEDDEYEDSTAFMPQVYDLALNALNFARTHYL